MGNYRELKAWQDAMDLLDSVYVSVRSFPRSEMFSLTDQLKRSAVAVAQRPAREVRDEMPLENMVITLR